MQVAIPAALIAIQLSVPAPVLAQQPEWPLPRNAPREFTARLSSLDPANTASVPMARDALVKGLGTWAPDEAEDAFRAFWAFYRTVVRIHDAYIDRPEMVSFLIKLCEARECGYYLLRALESSTDPAVVEALAANQRMLEPACPVRRNGVEVVYGEGNLYRAQDTAFLKALASHLPPRPFREPRACWTTSCGPASDRP